MWAKTRGIVIGSEERRGTATGKERVLGGVLFARDGIEKPEDSTRIRTGDRLEQVACQVVDLALEMTEDALQKASMYLRWWGSDRCASERCASERFFNKCRNYGSKTRTTTPCKFLLQHCNTSNSESSLDDECKYYFRLESNPVLRSVKFINHLIKVSALHNSSHTNLQLLQWLTKSEDRYLRDKIMIQLLFGRG